MKRLSGITVALTAWVSFPATAAVLVDHSQPTGQNFESVLASYQYLAQQFTLSDAVTITRVEGLISAGNLSSGQQETVVLRLYSDSAGLPSASLFSSSFEAANNFRGLQGADVTWSVSAGVYWIGFEPVGNTPSNLGMTASFPPTGPSAIKFEGSDYQDSLSSVSYRIFGDTQVAAVPEPATWGMMLIGFGLVGAVSRRRRLAATYA